MEIKGGSLRSLLIKHLASKATHPPGLHREELLSIACWHYFDVLPPEERPGVEESIKVERGNGEKKEEDSDQEARSR